MNVNILDALTRSPAGLWFLGTANLIGPLLGYCIQADGSTTCPVQASPPELAWWISVTAFFWLSSLGHEHLRWATGRQP